MSANSEIPDSTVQQFLEVTEPSRLQEFMTHSNHLIGRSLIMLGLITGVVAGEAVLIEPRPAVADNGGYPDSNKPCVDGVHNGQTQGTGYWCNKYQWGDSPSQQDSSRGYGYRNCTDWVAFRIPQLVQRSVPSGLSHAKYWDDNGTMPGTWIKDTTPEPGDIAIWNSGNYGHVEVVESVNADGTANTSGFNKHRDGKYDTQTRVVADHYLDLNGTGKGINGEDLTGGGGTPPPPPLQSS